MVTISIVFFPFLSPHIALTSLSLHRLLFSPLSRHPRLPVFHFPFFPHDRPTPIYSPISSQDTPSLQQPLAVPPSFSCQPSWLSRFSSIATAGRTYIYTLFAEIMQRWKLDQMYYLKYNHSLTQWQTIKTKQHNEQISWVWRIVIGI